MFGQRKKAPGTLAELHDELHLQMEKILNHLTYSTPQQVRYFKEPYTLNPMWCKISSIQRKHPEPRPELAHPLDAQTPPWAAVKELRLDHQSGFPLKGLQG